MKNLYIFLFLLPLCKSSLAQNPEQVMASYNEYLSGQEYDGSTDDFQLIWAREMNTPMPDEDFEIKPIWRIIDDFDKDGKKDTLYYDYKIVTDFIRIVDGANAKVYFCGIWTGELGYMLYSGRVPGDFCQPGKEGFIKAVEKALGEQYIIKDKPDPSLAFIFNGIKSYQIFGADSIIKPVFSFKNGFMMDKSWHPLSDLLSPETTNPNEADKKLAYIYRVNIEEQIALQHGLHPERLLADSLANEEQDEGELMLDERKPIGPTWYIYRSWNQFSCLERQKAPQLEKNKRILPGYTKSLDMDKNSTVYGSCHSLIEVKGDRFRYLFISDGTLVPAPEKLRWPSIEDVQKLGGLIILRQAYGNHQNAIYIIDTISSRVLQLNIAIDYSETTGEIYENAYVLKKHLIIESRDGSGVLLAPIIKRKVSEKQIRKMIKALPGPPKANKE